MPTTLTVCRGCLLQAKAGGLDFEARIAELQQRIARQIGPVDLQMEECLHHCHSQEVCVQLDRIDRRRRRWTHVKREDGYSDPACALLRN